MSSMVSTIAPIWSPLAPSSVTVRVDASTACLMRVMPVTVSATAAAPLSAAAAAEADTSRTSVEALSRASMAAVIEPIVVAAWASLVDVSVAPEPTEVMTVVRSPTARLVSDAPWA